MNEDRHPFDDAVRRLAGDVTPTDEDRRQALARLSLLIAEPSKPTARRGRIIAGVCVVAAAVIFVFLGLILRPTATGAAAEEIATAAEAADPITLPANSYLYTRAETKAVRFVPADGLQGVDYDKAYLTYQIPSERQTWVAADGTIQISTRNSTPVFFSPRDEAVYYAAGLDVSDAIGQTKTEVFSPSDRVEEWPTQPDDLDHAIRQALPDQGLPESVEYVDVAMDIIRERPVQPETRANLVRLIGRLPDLSVVQSDDDHTTFQIGYDRDAIAETYTFTLTSRGELAFEERRLSQPNPSLGIPTGTVLFSAKYSVPQVVTQLSIPAD